MSEALDYTVFDSDQHYYEPTDCFSRYFPEKHRTKAIHVTESKDGKSEIWIGEKPFTFLHWRFDKFAKAGALKQMLKLAQSPDYENQVLESVRPEFLSRKPRLELMDRQGVESCLMFPTLAVCVEHFMVDDPEQMYLNFHSFNRWLKDDWGYGEDGRIHAAPLLSLLDLDRAVEELD